MCSAEIEKEMRGGRWIFIVTVSMNSQLCSFFFSVAQDVVRAEKNIARSSAVCQFTVHPFSSYMYVLSCKQKTTKHCKL